MLEDVLHGLNESLPWQAVASIKLIVAALLGAFIGLEREYRGRGAGLRTHLLVSLGAAMAMIVSLRFADIYGKPDSNFANLSVDPARIAYGIMAGIGFLGAGAIIQSRRSIRGLTTAASLWCAAAIGLGCGFGMIIITSIATLLILFALIILARFEDMMPSITLKSIKLTLSQDARQTVKLIKTRLHEEKLQVRSIDYRYEATTKRYWVSLVIKAPHDLDLWTLQDIVGEIPHLVSIEIR